MKGEQRALAISINQIYGCCLLVNVKRQTSIFNQLKFLKDIRHSPNHRFINSRFPKSLGSAGGLLPAHYLGRKSSEKSPPPFAYFVAEAAATLTVINSTVN